MIPTSHLMRRKTKWGDLVQIVEIKKTDASCWERVRKQMRTIGDNKWGKIEGFLQIAGLLVIGDLAQTLKDIMVLKEELSSTVETITKDGRVNTLPINQSLSTKMSRVSYFGPALFFPHCRCLQQNGRYQAPKILPVCENNHNRPNLVFIGRSVVSWA